MPPEYFVLFSSRKRFSNVIGCSFFLLERSVFSAFSGMLHILSVKNTPFTRIGNIFNISTLIFTPLKSTSLTKELLPYIISVLITARISHIPLHSNWHILIVYQLQNLVKWTAIICRSYPPHTYRKRYWSCSRAAVTQSLGTLLLLSSYAYIFIQSRMRYFHVQIRNPASHSDSYPNRDMYLQRISIPAVKCQKRQQYKTAKSVKTDRFGGFHVAPPTRVERATHGFGNRRSIHWATRANKLSVIITKK